METKDWFYLFTMIFTGIAMVGTWFRAIVAFLEYKTKWWEKQYEREVMGKNKKPNE